MFRMGDMQQIDDPPVLQPPPIATRGSSLPPAFALGRSEIGSSLGTMGKTGAIILAVVGWGAVGVALRFHDIVPHASEDEIRPFLIAAIVFALVATGLLIKALASTPPAPQPPPRS
jgi:hypothetical protein